PLFPRSDSIVLSFRGSHGVNVHGLGAIVTCETVVDGAVLRQRRQLVGIGGRGGKQRAFTVHFGLADAAVARKIEIVVPDGKGTVKTLTDVKPGRHVVELRAPR
ncbi:MAG: ASPIC/UnbV domain-containing protein, partial [Planctomycetota bacterium]